MMREALVDYRWLGHDGMVHCVRAFGSDDIWHKTMGRIQMRSGEVRTMCGWRLGSDWFKYTHEGATCMTCAAGMFGVFREVPGHPQEGR